MSIYNSPPLGQLPAKVQMAAANRPDAVPKTDLPNGPATAVKHNFDLVTISEEGRAAAQVLNAAPVAGSSPDGLFLDAAADPSKPSTRDISAALKAAEEAYNKAAEEARKRSDAWSRACGSRNEMIEGLKDVSFSTYSPSTGCVYINMSAFDRYWKTKCWEWQEDLRVNDPEAYEAWVSKFGVKEEPRFSTSGEHDVYHVIDLTPDADGKTEMDYFYEAFGRVTRLAALIEAQYRESRKKEEEESGEPSAAERLETQNAKLEEALQTNDPRAFEIQSDMSDGSGPRQHEPQPN